MSIHTIYPGFRLPGFFTRENIHFISAKVTEILGTEFNARVIIPDSAIMREMQIQHEDRLQSIAKMNQRVIMELVRSFRNYQAEIRRASMWAQNMWGAYNYSPELGIKPYETPKLNKNARGMRFAMTY